MRKETNENLQEIWVTPPSFNENLLQRAYERVVDSRESIGSTPVSVLEKMSKEDQRDFAYYYERVRQLTDHWFANEVKTGRANFSVNRLEGE